MIKKMKKSFIVLLAATWLVGLMAPSKGFSWMLVNVAAGTSDNLRYDWEYNPAGSLIVCILLLPFCILGEDKTKSDHPVSYAGSVEELRANGMSDETISKVLSGQEQFISTLLEKGVKLEFSKTDHSNDIREALREVNKDLPPEFVDFYIRNQIVTAPVGI